MSTHNNNTPSSHSSYTPPTTSRFLAFGKSKPKYPASLGKSLPSTLSKDVNNTPKSSRLTLSALAPEFVPRSASGSTTSGSLPGSLQSSPLRSKNHSPSRPTKLVLSEQASSVKAVTRPFQHPSVPELYSPQFSTFESTAPHFIFPPPEKARHPSWINPLLMHVGSSYVRSLVHWDMRNPLVSLRVPSDAIHADLECLPAFSPDLEHVNVSIGEAPAYKAVINAPRTAIGEGGCPVYSVGRFLKMIEVLLTQPLEESYWEGISIYNKIDLIYAMAARLRISLPLYVADFREKELNDEADYAKIDAFQMEALQRTADTFARDPRTGQIRVIGEDYLAEHTIFHGIDWDERLKEFTIHTTQPPIN